MKLTKLSIDRFGARSNLQLDDLSDRLNVIYGPNGSGKTTILQFLRWVLFGNTDAQSARYLATGSEVSEGSITVRNQHQLQSIARRDDGTAAGKLSVRQGTGTWAVDPPHEYWAHGRLTDIDPVEFDNIFSISFERPYQIQDLVAVARRRGIELTYDHRQLDQLAQLQSRLDHLRDDLQRAPRLELTLAGLQDRREEVLRAIDNLHQQRRRWEEDWERERDELFRRLHTARADRDQQLAVIERLQGILETRRQQAQRELEQAYRLRDEAFEQRRRRIEELDQQIAEWQLVLDRVRQRYQALRNRVPENNPLNPHGYSREEEVELRHLLQTLGYRPHDIDADLADFRDWGWEHQEQAQLAYLRTAFGTALESMRHDISRLCQFLDHHHDRDVLRQHQGEIDHLRRMEHDLSDLIEHLAQQRQDLTWQHDRGATSASHLTSSTYARWQDDEHRLWSPVRAVESPLSSRYAAPYSSSDWSAVPLSATYPLGATPLADRRVSSVPPTVVPVGSLRRSEGSTYYGHPLIEARLRHLHLRLEQLQVSLRQAETLVSDLERQLADLEQRHRYWDRGQLDSFERELQHLDQQIRWAHDQELLRTEIRRLEEEIARLQESLRESDILRHASAMLRTMTAGQHGQIRIAHDGLVWVDNGHQQWVAFDQLSRGTRDQVYLSLCLALVENYRHQGFELPLFLNDIFINIDTDRARDVATTVEQFAQRGHQVIVFTRHEHILQLFQPLQARLFSLRPRVSDDRPWRRSETELGATGAYLTTTPTVSTSETGSIAAARPLPPPPVVSDRSSYEPRYQWVARWREQDQPESRPLHASTLTTPRAPAAPARPVPVSPVSPAAAAPRPVTPAAARPSHVSTPAGLTELSSLELVPALDRSRIQALREIGVHTVRDFLALSPSYAEQKLQAHGWTRDLVRRWQAEVALQLYAGLSDVEARLLIGCGIEDLSMLASLEVEAVLRRIEAYLSASDLQRIYGPSRDYTRARVGRWIETARRRMATEPRPETLDTTPREARPPRLYRDRRDGDARDTAPAVRRPEPVRSDLPRPDGARADVARAEAARPSVPLHVAAVPERPREKPVMRFFLEPADPIVDAPSIGPKTAEYLRAVGIQTVADLLAARPEVLAQQIDQQRVSIDALREWQLQARLVCRVPNLRGHDAQILVACDIFEPETLAAADPQTLWTLVDQFCNSNEGKRILRNGKKPDLEEIRSWIQWARSARQLRAA